jgi:hypothetical protein
VTGAAIAGLLAGGTGAGAGVLALRRAWRGPARRGWMLAGWGLLAGALFGWLATTGWDVALALTLLAPSLAAYAVLAAHAEIRPPRAPKPCKWAVVSRQGRGRRAIVRTLYAGPLSAAAALGLGAALALRAPLAEADRLVAGGLIVPLAWAAGMVWATTDARLARIGLGLGAVVAVSIGAAWL